MTPTKKQEKPKTKSAVPKAHVALHVRDLARSVEFYRKLFAAEPVKSAALTPNSILPSRR